MTKQKLFSKKKQNVKILITTHLDAEGAGWPGTKLFILRKLFITLRKS